MHAANFSASGLIALALSVFLKGRLPLPRAIFSGGLCFVCLAAAGWFISLIASL